MRPHLGRVMMKWIGNDAWAHEHLGDEILRIHHHYKHQLVPAGSVLSTVRSAVRSTRWENSLFEMLSVQFCAYIQRRCLSARGILFACRRTRLTATGRPSGDRGRRSRIPHSLRTRLRRLPRPLLLERLPTHRHGVRR